MKFNEVLELAKRAEHTVNSQLGPKHAEPEGTKPKDKSKSQSTKGSGSNGTTYSRERLTQKEKAFLTHNIQRGGGLIVNETVRNKWEWIKWAQKEGLCRKCAGKGHRILECKADAPK